MALPSSFGAWLRSERGAKGLSQQDFAVALGCDLFTLRQMERNLRRPSKEQAERALEVLAVDPSLRQALLQLARLGVIVAEPGQMAPAEPAPPLVGRAQDLEALADLIKAGQRLLTLHGPAGVGKTRLALALTEQLGAETLVVSLEGVCDLELAWALLRQAVGGAASPHGPLVALEQALRSRRLTLVLTGCDEVPSLVAALEPLVATLPGLVVLATYRAATPPGYAVAPLAPADAVSLLQALAPEATLPDALLERLRGLPLYLELLAAQVRAMVLVKGGLVARAGLSLHPYERLVQAQGLAELVQTIYSALDPLAQRVLVGCSVFAGRFPLRALQLLLGPEVALEPALGALVKAAFLRASGNDYELPAALRALILGRVEPAVLEELRLGHAAWVAALVAEEGPRLLGAERDKARARLQRYEPELRAALAWHLGRAESVAASTLALGLAPLWFFGQRCPEGLLWLTRILAAGAELPLMTRLRLAKEAGVLAYGDGDLVRAQVLYAEALGLAEAEDARYEIASLGYNLGLIALQQGRYADVEALYRPNATLWRELGEERELANTLTILGISAVRRGRLAEAMGLYRESQAYWRRANQPLGMTGVLNNIGECLIYQGEYEQAERYLNEVCERSELLGNQAFLAAAQANLGLLALRRAEYPQAAAWLLKALEQARRTHDEATAADCLHYAALVLAQSGRWIAAVELLGSHHAQRAQQNLQLAWPQAEEQAELLAAAREHLPSIEVFEHWLGGTALSAEQAARACSAGLLEPAQGAL